MVVIIGCLFVQKLFWQTFASNSYLNLYIDINKGSNFKALKKNNFLFFLNNCQQPN